MPGEASPPAPVFVPQETSTPSPSSPAAPDPDEALPPSLSSPSLSPPLHPGGLDLYLEPTRLLGQLGGPKEWPWPGPLSRDGSLSLEGQLERRWLQWYEFMTDRSHLEDWLQRAEQMAAAPNTCHVLHVVAKEELNKFQALQAECRARVAQLDSLTLRSRSLLRHFDGAMRARLVAMTKDCSQRWDRLTEALECICRRLRHCVSQREAFDQQREEMAVWLADMDLRLTEVEHFSSHSTLSKMHQLQNFQEAVAENASRLSSLLELGEALIQRSEPSDAQTIESHLQELLLYCAHVFEGVGRLHTRLHSMRLVFEEDWALASHVDSGCPSETPPDDEESCDWTNSSKPKAGPTQSPQDHLLLEWDPSVDIGGSVSHDDADSSYFSAITGGGQVEFLTGLTTGRRKSRLSTSNGHRPTAHKVCVSRGESAAPLPRAAATTPSGHSDCSADSDGGSIHERHPLHLHTSTPAGRAPEPVTFDPERISAWLGQTGCHLTEAPERGPCSKAVQTEDSLEQALTAVCFPRRDCPPHQDQTCAVAHTLPTRSRDSPLCSDWTSRSRHSQSQCVEEGPIVCPDQEEEEEEEEEEVRPLLKPCAPCWSEDSPAWLHDERQGRLWWLPWRQRKVPGGVVLHVLLGFLLVLLLLGLGATAWYPEVACHRANGLARSFHLALRYVNGPPPT